MGRYRQYLAAVVLAAGTQALSSCADAPTPTAPDRDDMYAAPSKNRPPVADAGGPYQTAVGHGLQFDGTKSVDPDGPTSKLRYSWTFGDGASGAGARPTHSYTTEGTYVIVLRVTDAKGAVSAPDSSSVTVSSTESPNVPPTADAGGPYTGTAGTAIQFDGRGSSDPDGDLPLTYQWTFGDGTTATGATPTHTYAAEGTYDVTLIVTDALGAVSSADSATATVSAPPVTNVLVKDAFSRLVTNGWGTADAGGPWRIDPDVIGSFSVDGSRGLIVAPSNRARNVIATDGYGVDVSGLVSFSIDRMPDNPGRFYTVQVYARRDDRVGDGDNYYRYRVRAFGTGQMDLRVEKSVQSTSTWVTSLQAISTVWQPGQRYWIRWEAVGASPATALRMRVWADGSPEPTTWQLSETVNEPALDVLGTTGIRVEGPNADQVNFPITFSFDDLQYTRVN